MVHNLGQNVSVSVIVVEPGFGGIILKYPIIVTYIGLTFSCSIKIAAYNMGRSIIVPKVGTMNSEL